jgi:cytoskeletal protein CcmA (bactofilin family)
MKRMAIVICVLAIAGIARAEDKSNPTGTWKYTAEVNGQSIEVTIKLKLEGDKLTGTVSALDTESKIEDSKYQDGEVSFRVNREVNGNKFTIKYKGQIKGDIFKGKRELERDGQRNTREFEAKRSKE